MIEAFSLPFYLCRFPWRQISLGSCSLKNLCLKLWVNWCPSEWWQVTALYSEGKGTSLRTGLRMPEFMTKGKSVTEASGVGWWGSFLSWLGNVGVNLHLKPGWGGLTWCWGSSVSEEMSRLKMVFLEAEYINIRATSSSCLSLPNLQPAVTGL